MKIRSNDCFAKPESGSALLMVLILSVATLIVVIGYMAASTQQLTSIKRSQTWNTALPIVEAGIEEAFAHLNKDCYSNSVNFGNLNWTNDNWTANGTTNLLTVGTRYIGSNSGYYDVRILTNYPSLGITQTKPEIVCVGSVPFWLKGTNTSLVQRQVRVQAVIMPMFLMGMLASGNITGHGQMMTDAFNSAVWSNSFYGYYDPRYNTAQGGVGSINGVIDLGSQGTVYGNSETGPSTNSYITNGAVGDMAWITNHNTGVEPGHYTNTLNTELTAPTLPPDAFIPLTACNCNVTYTNPSRTAVTVTTDFLPSPLPPGPITTNNSAAQVVTTNYPNPVPVGGVYTSMVSQVFTTLPSPIPSNIISITTNPPSTSWLTNNATSQTTPPPLPTGYLNPPGIVLITNKVSNYLPSPPPANCYVGSWSYVYVPDKKGNLVPDTSGNGSKVTTNYTYYWISAYAYQPTNTTNYTLSWYKYQYTNASSFTYETTNSAQEVVTSQFLYNLGTGFWSVDSISLTHQQIIVTGNAVLYVPNGIKMSGNGEIVIINGASLTLYVGGDVDIKGNGFANENGNAANFSLYGLSNCTSISFGGNAAFTGTVYAPNADITAGGGGNDGTDIVGAITGRTITFNGHFSLHFDSNLLNKGPTVGYVGTSWVEEAAGTLP